MNHLGGGRKVPVIETIPKYDNDSIRVAIQAYNKSGWNTIIEKYGDIQLWNVENVTDMTGLFTELDEFNADLSRWKPINVKSTNTMFSGCTKFNNGTQKGDPPNPLSWYMPKIETASNMFRKCTNLNVPIVFTGLYNLTETKRMFDECTNFNNGAQQGKTPNPLSWFMPSLRLAESMFRKCTTLNVKIEFRNVYDLEDTKQMFFGCTQFNNGGAPIDWVVPIVPMNGDNMKEMFYECRQFNNNKESLSFMKNTNIIESQYNNMFNGTLYKTDFNYKRYLTQNIFKCIHDVNHINKIKTDKLYMIVLRRKYKIRFDMEINTYSNSLKDQMRNLYNYKNIPVKIIKKNDCYTLLFHNNSINVTLTPKKTSESNKNILIVLPKDNNDIWPDNSGFMFKLVEVECRANKSSASNVNAPPSTTQKIDENKNNTNTNKNNTNTNTNPVWNNFFK
jgi:hypothetical protein